MVDARRELGELALADYTVTAFNYAESSENKIHSDDVAVKFGFKGGLVPGVGDFAYMSRAFVAAWGLPWEIGGAIEAKFIKPIYHGERATAHAYATNSDDMVSLVLENEAGEVCATGLGERLIGAEPPVAAAYITQDLPPDEARFATTPESFCAGTVLGSLEETYQEADAHEQARMFFVEALDHGGQSVWHPALCLHEANRILRSNVALGSWIHTASRVEYFSPPEDNETLSLRGRVIDTYEKRGHVMTDLDLAMFADADRALVRIRHTAIIKLRGDD
jgi:acyl dehydratase